jgi:hypothetical protein
LLLSATASAGTVVACLADAQGRLTRQGGREGLARSLGSVYGACVARFLNGGLRGREHSHFQLGFRACNNGLAASHDGARLLVSALRQKCVYEVFAGPGEAVFDGRALDKRAVLDGGFFFLPHKFVLLQTALCVSRAWATSVSKK